MIRTHRWKHNDIAGIHAPHNRYSTHKSGSKIIRALEIFRIKYFTHNAGYKINIYQVMIFRHCAVYKSMMMIKIGDQTREKLQALYQVLT